MASRAMEERHYKVEGVPGRAVTRATAAAGEAATGREGQLLTHR